MEKTVYIDLLFLINFSMDFLCFYISARIISVKLYTPRALLAAVMGGIYSGAVLFVPASPPLAVVADVAVCLVMCLIAFGGRKIGIIFATLVYFSVSMALGGFMTALFNLLNRMGFSSLGAEGVEGDGISVWLFLLLAAVSALFTLLGGRSFRRRSSAKSVTLTVRYENREKKLTAMVDSGNLLREPISGRACIAVEIEALRGILRDEVLAAARDGKVSSIEALGSSTFKNLRLIPTHTATGEKILVGTRVDSIVIDVGKGEYESDAYLVLTSLNAPQGIEALVPSELLN